MDDVLVDGTSFSTIPSDKYYNDLYCHFHALYSTLPWQALSLGDLHLGLASMLNAAWGNNCAIIRAMALMRPHFPMELWKQDLDLLRFSQAEYYPPD